MSRVRTSRAGAVGRVTLARPDKKNALDRTMVDELADAMRAMADDPAVRVVLLDADGPDFCAGADLAALAAMLDATPEVHADDAEALGRVFIAIREMAKPVVAAVRGRALAGGAGLASACDIVVAHEGAQFGYPEVRVGFVAAMVMTMLRRAVGEKRAMDLVATGRLISAADALAMGLVSRVASDADFDAEVAALVDSLGAAPPNAMRLTKRLLYELDTLSFRDGIARGVAVNVESRGTPDFRDGVLRFTNRPPR
ncbi:MAG TPA: enoyl-CoA hydratase/isomerase family protein [Gemmatimonadaceae bacterium]|nr:enoyl-CoA hydratase/isomerase family protein [Gemmatimonadaceae bacterium]